MGTKNKADCRSHYFATYVNVPTAPLPDFSSIGRCKPIEPPAKSSSAGAAAKAAAAGAGAAADDAPDAADGGVSERTFLKADGSGESVWAPSATPLPFLASSFHMRSPMACGLATRTVGVSLRRLYTGADCMPYTCKAVVC